MEKIPNLEKITKPAIRYKNIIVTGNNHYEAFLELQAQEGTGINEANIEDGYLTSNGRFVGRQEALKIAESAGQLDTSDPGIKHITEKPDGELSSSDFEH